MTFNRIAPLLVIMILIAGLALLSKGMMKTSVPDTDDDAPAQTAPHKVTGPPQIPEVPISEELAPEMTMGNPADAKEHITIGWIYDPTVMNDPQALLDVLSAVGLYERQNQGLVSVQEANLDLPKQELSPAYRSISTLGIEIDGKTSMTVNGKTYDLTGNPGEGNLTKDKVQSFLNAISN